MRATFLLRQHTHRIMSATELTILTKKQFYKYVNNRKKNDATQITDLTFTTVWVNGIPPRNTWTELPDLSRFTALRKLTCDKGVLTCLPDNLPDTLEEINCHSNEITHLPEMLPYSLRYLNCGLNKITQLPSVLPEGLTQIMCHENKLTCLPDHLPDSLLGIDCNDNAITRLPDMLPAGLQSLTCYRNQLTRLPAELQAEFLGEHADALGDAVP
jgi:Leucine-rich repeat (LRR) protein